MASYAKSLGAEDAKASGNDQAGRSIFPHNIQIARDLQVARLTRRYAITAAMAAIIAPLAFGEAQQ